MQLDPAAAAAGVRLIVHDSVGSTNAEALSAARAAERGPLWITAAQQTAGRGRRGRPFVSERGNIRSRRITGACRRHQNQIARAVKRARELALLPYVAEPGERGSRSER